MGQRDRFVIGMPLGRWQTNCYVVGDRAAGGCVVVDPGEGALEALPGVLETAGVPLEAILLTHGHLDHHWSAPDLARLHDVPVLLHAADRWIWDQPQRGFGEDVPFAMLEQQFGIDWRPADDHLETIVGDTSLRFAGLRFEVRHNPGHTPGHVTYLAHGLADAEVTVDLGDPSPARRVLFSGDLVFAGSIGRHDFPRSSGPQIMQSLRDTVLALDDDVVILSGHGTDTTVGHERRTNPFLLQLQDS